MTQQNPPAETHPFAALATLQEPLLNGAARSGALCARGLVTWQQEMLDFATRRLRENGEAGVALLRCRTPGEIAEVQQDWLRTALDAYAAEGDRLLEVAGETAEAVVAEAEAICRPFVVAAAELPPTEPQEQRAAEVKAAGGTKDTKKEKSA